MNTTRGVTAHQTSVYRGSVVQLSTLMDGRNQGSVAGASNVSNAALKVCLIVCSENIMVLALLNSIGVCRTFASILILHQEYTPCKVSMAKH